MTHPNSATHCPERLCCEVRAPVRRDHQRDVEGADPPVMDEPGRRLRRAVPGRQQHQVAAEDILHLQNITKRMTVSLGERTNKIHLQLCEWSVRNISVLQRGTAWLLRYLVFTTHLATTDIHLHIPSHVWPPEVITCSPPRSVSTHVPAERRIVNQTQCLSPHGAWYNWQ